MGTCIRGHRDGGCLMMLASKKERALFTADLVAYYHQHELLSDADKELLFNGWLLRKRAALDRVLKVLPPGSPASDCPPAGVRDSAEPPYPYPAFLLPTFTQEVVLEISERRTGLYDDEDGSCILPEGESEVYLVSTRKLKDWLPGHEHEFRYVQSIVEACLAGKSSWTATYKYSFSDCPSFYESLAPDAGSPDPVLPIEVSITN